MANKFPLILNTSANQIQEIASGDNLDLTGCGINNAGVITATSFSGNITGAVTGNSDTATEATNVTVTANNSTSETVYPIFVDGATGTQGAESDTGLTYNPSSGNLTSTQFTGTLQTAAQTNITSVGTLSALNVSGNVSIGGTLTYEDVTNIDSVGLITARTGVVSPYADIDDWIDVGSHIQLGNAGIVTAKGADINGDIDVDGHTNLDNVSIAGVVTATTFVGNGDFVELDVDGHTNLDNVSIAGVTTFTGNTIRQNAGYVSINVGSTNAGGAALVLDGDSNGDFTGNDYSLIQHNTDGHLIIQANAPAAANVYIKLGASGHYGAMFKEGAESLLRYNNSTKIATTDTGAQFTGTDFGFNATPGGNPAAKNVFLAIGDSDTGIVQDGDGQLELWANNNEVANINAIDGYTSTKPITTTGNISGRNATFFLSSGQAQVNIGSGNAGGALIALDGDSNGDVSGGDFAYLKHDTSGDLIIAAGNPSNDSDIKFQTSDSATLALTLAGTNATFTGRVTAADFLIGGNAWYRAANSGYGGLYNATDQTYFYSGDANWFECCFKSDQTYGGIRIRDGYDGHTSGYLVAESNTNDVGIKTRSFEWGVRCTNNGTTYLYDDGAPKLYTQSTGVNVTGQFKATNSGASNLTAARFENTTSNSNAHCRVQIATAANQGADPYIHFDSGGSNFVVGQKWEGTTNNYLLLGAGDSPEGGVTGMKIMSWGAIHIENEFNLQSFQGGSNTSKYMDVGFQGNSFSMRRTTWNDGSHANFIHVSSTNVCNGDFNDTSDEKLKKNIVSIADGAIANIKKLRPVTFDWKDDLNRNDVSGFIAQEMKTVLPNLIDGEEYDPTPLDSDRGIKGGIKGNGYSINTVGVVAHLTKALQEAIAKIETLETKVAALESS